VKESADVFSSGSEHPTRAKPRPKVDEKPPERGTAATAWRACILLYTPVATEIYNTIHRQEALCPGDGARIPLNGLGAAKMKQTGVPASSIL
jgi:hypothetical protein